MPGWVAQTRALWGSLCADGGAPRLVGVAGTGSITCGSTRALEDAGLAEVRAWSTQGDGLRAALERVWAAEGNVDETPARVIRSKRCRRSVASRSRRSKPRFSKARRMRLK